MEFTGSPRAIYVLENWTDLIGKFVKVFPHEYKRVLGVPRLERAVVPVLAAMPPVTVSAASAGD
jgi:glutamate synthase domain-containing protein 3